MIRSFRLFVFGVAIRLGVPAFVHNPEYAIKELPLKEGSDDLQHLKEPTYRCFLPDLAGFIRFHCTGSGPSFKKSSQI